MFLILSWIYSYNCFLHDLMWNVPKVLYVLSDWQIAQLITVCSTATHVTVCLSVYISAWKSVRRCAAVLPSWWKDSSDVWALCSTLKIGPWPPLILHSDQYCSTSLFLTVCVNTTHLHCGDLWMVMCKIAFAGLAAASLWRCTWLRLPATQMQSPASCSAGSPALTLRWALSAIWRILFTEGGKDYSKIKD